MTQPQPRQWPNPTDWFQLNRQWQSHPPADLYGTVHPDVVQAAGGHTFVVTLRLGPTLTLSAGAHVTLEIPWTWDVHLANTYRRGVHIVGSRSQVRAGYGAFADATSTNPGVELALAASWGRLFDLLDVVLTRGTLHPGDELRVVLGTPDGNLVQAQLHAQLALLTTGVDAGGDGTYRRAAAHPSVRVVGASADRLRLFGPATVRPGEAFALRVLPVDGYRFNPATGYQGTARLEATLPGALHLPETVALDTRISPLGAVVPAQAAASAVPNASASPVVAYVSAFDAAQGIGGRSNPIGIGFHPGRPDLRIYFGELHSQMRESMGSGTTEEFFRWGRDVAGLDFCAPANHYNHRFEVSDDLWRDLVDTCNRFDQPGRFATLVSYEWGGTRGSGGAPGSGHKNVYYRGSWGEFAYWYRGVHATPDDLWASLRGRDVLTIPHHTKFGALVDWRFRNDQHQRLVEICSQWGISESGGPHSVQAALSAGHRLGFVGGTDSHDGLANQGSYHVNDGNGLTAVCARQLTRDAIWQALYNRHCYATTGDRILLDVTVDGLPMGTDLAANLQSRGPRTLAIRVAGTAPLELVEVLRNNEVVQAWRPASPVWHATWTDSQPLAPLALPCTFAGDRPFVFYYVRVRQANRQQAWSSPIWFTQQEERGA